MEIIGKISKGTNMDQIYISKQRDGMPIGEYVLIKPITIDEKILRKWKEYTQEECINSSQLIEKMLKEHLKKRGRNV